MPVTVDIVDHPAVDWNRDSIATSEKLLEASCPKQWRRCERIVQSSFDFSELSDDYISSSQNGFVWSAYHAYSSHHHLVIRPEDVWFAILTQLSFYINAHADELRSFFVAHSGKKELEAISDIADFGALAVQMTDLIQKNVLDPDLKEWVMPSFSTTTYTDKVVGAVLFMGAMQSYFSYKMALTCGLPSITILGNLDDWKEILRRLDLIPQLGKEAKQFAKMLTPIVQHMMLTFEEPDSAGVKDFWNTIVHHNRVGSGTDYLSGWLTAFCFWNEDGEAKGMMSVRSEGGNVLFGNVAYPYVEIDKIPTGFASVPVHVDDNGHEYDAVMVAGSVGIKASSSNTSIPIASAQDQAEQVLLGTSAASSPGVSRDTVQPISGWWIYEMEPATRARERDEEKQRLEKTVEQSFQNWKDSGRGSDSPFWKDFLAASERLEELEAF